MCFPQWNISNPRTAGPSIPSPTSTVNSFRITPKPRTADRLNATQMKRDVRQAHIDSNLQFLIPPGTQSYHLTPNADHMVDPITRLCRSEGPWNPHQMRNSNVSIGQNAAPYIHEDFSQYRQGVRSEVDNASDSGYQTQPARSVFGNEPGYSGQELPVDFMLQTKNMNVNIGQNLSLGMVRTTSDQRSVSQHSSRSGRHGQTFPCYATGCNVISKCESERKYVLNATYAVSLI